ncbi:glutamate receptor U1 [Cylas formicarius]|uniref:glutamate receptor U1 n=1 Tax=Cylas formicarius TaxID=197179 RepID=UPI0029585A1B|nr:glutamate receptor U1 [Cylas formicarius]
MGLMELIVSALCLNATCTDDNLEKYSIRKDRYFLLADQLKHENLRITTLMNGHLSGYEIINGSIVGKGVAFDIIEILQNEYKFNYTVVVPDDNVFYENSHEKGIKNMLLNGEADVAATFLPMTYNETIRYSRSLDTAEWVVLMLRPKESATGSGLLAPFTASVWTLIIISLLIVGPILYLVVFIRVKMCEDDRDAEFSLPACMWFVYGALLKQGSTLNPKSDSSRLLFSTWWIFITILTAFYTANLTAFLTLSKFTLPINKPEDIVKKRYQWVTNRGNGIITFMNDQQGILQELIGPPKFQIDSTDKDILHSYVSKNFMYIREKTVLDYIMYDDYKEKTKEGVQETQRCTYVVTTFPITTLPRAFAFSPTFKYFDLFDITIQYLIESGIIEFKEKEFLPDTVICPLNLGNKERRLRNSDLTMTYNIVGGGLIVATITFALEFAVHSYKRNGCCCRDPKDGHQRPEKITGHFPKGNGLETKWVSPPPSYHTLFNDNYANNYWYENNGVNKKQAFSMTPGIIGSKGSLVPYKTSIFLFQFTK